MVPQQKKVAPYGIESVDTNSQFAMDALVTQNKYRALHNVPPLAFNENLSKIAQQWADSLGKTQKLEHSPLNWRKYKNVPLGENLAYLFNSPLTGQKMIDMW